MASISIPKRAACLLACAVLCVSVLPHTAAAEVRKDDIVAGQTVEARGLSSSNVPAVDAEHVYVMDSDGTVYFERAATDEVKIASITKMMTAMVALENANLDDVVTVSHKATEIGGSTAYLIEGDKLTLKDALLGLMVPSGNDAGEAIAETVGAKLVQKAKESGQEVLDYAGNPINLDSENAASAVFVAKMNEKGAELGCEQTLFTNPHGFDEDQFAGEPLHSTAKDVAKMAAEAMKNADFRDLVDNKEAVITVDRGGREVEIELLSTDFLLGEYEGACGIKTGFTDYAGECFVGACERDGKDLYAVVLNAPSKAQKFNDTKILYDWVYNSNVDYNLANSEKSTKMQVAGSEYEVPVIADVALAEWTDKTVPATLADASLSVNVSSIFGNVSQEIVVDEVKGSVAVGDKVGVANFYQNNQKIFSADLIACEDVEAPSVLESIGISWQRLISNFTGEATCADTVVYNETPLLLTKN